VTTPHPERHNGENRGFGKHMTDKLGAKPCPRSGLKLWTLFAVTLAFSALAGCGGSPYVDSRREAGQTTPVGASTPDRVAICYSDYGATPDDLQKMAESECAKTGRRAQYEGRVRMTCTLLTPSIAYYNCVP